MAENGASEESEPLLDEQPSEDLFPHLESLVPSELGTFGVIAEAFRLLSQHFKLFLLPILVVTVQTFLGIGFQLWGPYPNPTLGLSIPSWTLRTTALHRDSFSSSSDGAWAGTLLGLVSLLLSGLAEASLDRAAVGAFLQESYGPDQAPASTWALLLAALRAIATTVAALITTAVLTFVAATAGILAIALLNGVLPAYDAAQVVAAAVAFVLWLIVFTYITVVLIVAVPAAVVTKEWGFKALLRSFSLSKGNRAAALKLVLLSFVVSLIALGVVGVTPGWSKAVVIGAIVVAGVVGWIINLGWFLVRIVVYLKFRASHKIAVKHVGA